MDWLYLRSTQFLLKYLEEIQFFFIAMRLERQLQNTPAVARKARKSKKKLQ